MSDPKSQVGAKDEVDLSVVIRVVGGKKFLHNCLQALSKQIQNCVVEVIVPYDSTVSDVNELKREYPQVVFVELEESPLDISSPGALHNLYDLQTAAGLHKAQGKVIALLEDFAIPNPDWCEQILKAHELPYPAIGGAIEHSGRSSLNWAVYFLDFGRYQLPFEEGPGEYLSDVNISYKKEVLDTIKNVWEKQYNEVQVNWTLLRKGMILWRRPQIIVLQDRGKLAWKEAILERYYWGKIFGWNRVNYLTFVQRLILLSVMPLMPFLLVWRIIDKVITGRRNRVSLIKALPFMSILACSWCIGETAGYLQR
jgi:hypothetical protein